ncbi:MAG TPA: hypothetical protein VHN14_07285 [Kofleriaceae bacterium]|nr:hypothetical protein [Kofleriaceae bacterium]
MAQLVVQDLDDSLTAKHWLFAAIHRTEPAFIESLAKDEFTNATPGKLVPVRHALGKVTLTIAITRMRRAQVFLPRYGASTIQNKRRFHRCAKA